MTKHKKMKKQEEEQVKPQNQLEQFSSEEVSSSQDEEAALLTSKVEEKLLSTFVKIKLKHPSIYKNKEALYQQEDFDGEQKPKEKKNGKSKYTYQDLVNETGEVDDENLPPAMEEKKAKEKFKNALNQTINNDNQGQDDLFTVKTKIIPEKRTEKKQQEKDKIKDLTKNYDKESKKLIKQFWNSDQLDQTDLFLKNYILDRQWLSSKGKPKQNMDQEVIDEEDQKRSQEMDRYEADYNFRYQEPGGTHITQYPRQVQNSLRQKTESRREKRKKREEKKKQEEQELKKKAQIRKEQLKKEILDKIVPENEEGEEEDEHDWFFCDDCCRGLQEGEQIWQCTECEDFMLCDECNQLIIHKHQLTKGSVPEGFAAPQQGEDRVKQLQPCTVCRRRITPAHKSYQYTDRNYIVNALCQICYDKSGLDMQKKYKLVQPKTINYEEVLEQDPEKIKELTNLKEIEEMVDEYMQNDFEDVISGGIKTKFRYLSVKPESYGLSDEQILFGEDKQLNKYVSIKRLAPYAEETMRLRNSIFKQKIKGIKRSVKQNQNLVNKAPAKMAKMRYLAKRKTRVESVRKRLQKKLKVVNISNKEVERNHFVSQNRLLSYGIANDGNQS